MQQLLHLRHIPTIHASELLLRFFKHLRVYQPFITPDHGLDLFCAQPLVIDYFEAGVETAVYAVDAEVAEALARRRSFECVCDFCAFCSVGCRLVGLG